MHFKACDKRAVRQCEIRLRRGYAFAAGLIRFCECHLLEPRHTGNRWRFRGFYGRGSRGFRGFYGRRGSRDFRGFYGRRGSRDFRRRCGRLRSRFGGNRRLRRRRGHFTRLCRRLCARCGGRSRGRGRTRVCHAEQLQEKALCQHSIFRAKKDIRVFLRTGTFKRLRVLCNLRIQFRLRFRHRRESGFRLGLRDNRLHIRRRILELRKFFFGLFQFVFLLFFFKRLALYLQLELCRIILQKRIANLDSIALFDENLRNSFFFIGIKFLHKVTCSITVGAGLVTPILCGDI